MRIEVSSAIEELQRQFSSAVIGVEEDGSGGAIVIMEPIGLGPKYQPPSTWFGFQIPAQYPYADIYPVFMGADVSRADGVQFEAPVTRGHQFFGRQAIQISRRNSSAANGAQTAAARILKILDYLKRIPS